MKINMTPILPFCNKATARRALAQFPPWARPDQIFCGAIGAITFLVTLDHDGKCEASLFSPIGEPSSQSIAAFFAKWGIPIPADPPARISGGRGLHWVVSPGLQQ